MKVLITGRLPADVQALIEREHEIEINTHDRPMDRERLIEGIKNKDGLLCMITDEIDKELLNEAGHLKMIANYGVGFNNIDIAAAGKNGIMVSNTPGVLTDTTADLAFALILATGRRIVEGDKKTRSGRFQFWAPQHFLGREITGKVLGIVGFGRIGKAVAKRAAGFDMKVIYHTRTRPGESDKGFLNADFTDFETLLKESDFVSLHVPLLKETRHLIGKKELLMMKTTAYLINTARGPVVNETALYEALKSGQIAGAGLDVYEKEPAFVPGLADLDNVILLPHVGSATVETRAKMARMAAENLLAGLKGEIPPNCLNCDVLYVNK